MMRIEDRHWRIWAMRARSSAGGHIGYPRKQPWYLPVVDGYPEHDERDELGHIPPEDDEIADTIGVAVGKLLQVRPLAAKALIAWWGALPGDESFERNLQRLKVRRHHWEDCRNLHRLARVWCEALIEWASNGKVA